jgi:hypothetical protein
MRPARRVHDALSTDMIVSSVAVALQQTLEVAHLPYSGRPPESILTSAVDYQSASAFSTAFVASWLARPSASERLLANP